MKRRLLKNSLKIFFVYFALSLLVAPLRSGEISIGTLEGFCLSSFVGFVALFFLTLYFLRKCDKALQMLVPAVTGFFCLVLVVCCLNWQGTKMARFEFLIHLLAFVSAYAVYLLRGCGRKIGIVCSLLALMGAYCLSIYSYRGWSNYVNHGTWNGRLKKELNAPLCFQATRDSVVCFEPGGELLLLDFWISSCGYCFEAFPKVQELYEICREGNVKVYSVFVAIRPNEDYALGDSLLRARGYTFPVLALPKDSPVLQDFEVSNYPTVVVVDKTGRCCFKGNIEAAAKYVKGLLKSN